MKRLMTIAMLCPALCLLASNSFSDTQGGKPDGKVAFEKHCAVCHPKGGNTINPQKTLSKKSMKAHGIKSAKDVVAQMRNPGPGMTKFDTKTLPDKEAKAIAEYILKSFP